MVKKRTFALLIPLSVVVLLWALSFTPFFQDGEHQIYDQLLHFKRDVRENSSILLVNIDDTSISKVGVWPWSRNIMADSLLLLKEFEARSVVLDIEYVEESPKGFDPMMLYQTIPESFDEEFSIINQNIQDLFSALAAGQISAADVADYIRDLVDWNKQTEQTLLEMVNKVARDNDKYLGKAAALAGNIYFTIRMMNEENTDLNPLFKAWAESHLSLKNIKISKGKPHQAQGIQPTTQAIIENARGAGFPNIIVDNDGVRRRVDLISEYNGKYYAQLVMPALLDYLEVENILFAGSAIVLEKATSPDGRIKDIRIPLTEQGNFLINWPRKKYDESFKAISFWNLILHKQLEERLLENLKEMDDTFLSVLVASDTQKYLDVYMALHQLLESYKEAEEQINVLLTKPHDQGLAAYFQVRSAFFSLTGEFVASKTENDLVGLIQSGVAVEELTAEQEANYLHFVQELKRAFAGTREVYENLRAVRLKLADSVKDSLCIIGATATSTHDLGVNPFQSAYPNVGTHAAVLNSIIEGDFLDELPDYYSWMLALILSLVVYYFIRNSNPAPAIMVGLGLSLLTVLGGSLFFIISGIYLKILMPFMSVFLTFLLLTLMKFLITAKEKSFIHNAFGHYISKDVVNELITHPDMLKLGGEKRFMTALFTDVKGFSSISEVLDPTDLVKLLNSYLTEMSNILMQQKATIDKYEGDAIMAFFGAPLDMKDHASMACLAAIKMKKMEQILNRHFVENKISPTPLMTRIGINSGDMVVGNMGTLEKMDYTIMGNSVNLASRLEGTNKQYGTWMIISETTKKEGGAPFATRMLDRVRVVGIKEPVRLYELVDEKDSIDDVTKEGLEIFHQGLESFENKQWDQAIATFRKVLKLLPGDGPSLTFLKRCQEFKKKPPPANWDGVFNLTMK